jgi:hypothetical protein
MRGCRALQANSIFRHFGGGAMSVIGRIATG